MKGYIMYKVGHVTLEKEYVKNFEALILICIGAFLRLYM